MSAIRCNAVHQGMSLLIHDCCVFIALVGLQAEKNGKAAPSGAAAATAKKYRIPGVPASANGLSAEQFAGLPHTSVQPGVHLQRSQYDFNYIPANTHFTRVVLLYFFGYCVPFKLVRHLRAPRHVVCPRVTNPPCRPCRGLTCSTDCRQLNLFSYSFHLQVGGCTCRSVTS